MMKLTLKQIAIFGQVKVNIKSLDSNAIIYATLLDLYKAGWWVTDRFGTIITIVKPKMKAKDGFCCICRRISTTVNLDTLDLLTKQIADAQYEQYKNTLKSKRFDDKVKKSKKVYYENIMSNMSSGNRNSHNNVLRASSKRNVRKVSATEKRP